MQFLIYLLNNISIHFKIIINGQKIKFRIEITIFLTVITVNMIA